MTKSKKKRYEVYIPITGQLYYQVEARDAGSAKSAAWARYEEGDHGDEEPTWEALECVASGNVTHAMLNDVDVQELDEAKP